MCNTYMQIHGCKCGASIFCVNNFCCCTVEFLYQQTRCYPFTATYWMCYHTKTPFHRISKSESRNQLFLRFGNLPHGQQSPVGPFFSEYNRHSSVSPFKGFDRCTTSVLI